MKKTISFVALAVSSSSFALIGPPTSPTVTRTYCLNMYGDAAGSMMAGTCDQSANNRRNGVQLGENGCAEGQISLTTVKSRSEREFPIKIRACIPSNVTQL